MSYLDMKSELAEAIPGLSRIYAGTMINRAWRVVRNSTLWSFQLKQGSFSTPSQVSNGSVTVTSPPSTTIIGDATATAAWNALVYPMITQYQFRLGPETIYNVVGYDNGQTVGQGNYPFATITLDQPLIDPVTTLANNAYILLQCYYVAPSKTFRRWLSVQDMVNGYALRIWNTRRDLNTLDPQRQITTDPTDMLGLGQDARSGSATLGWPMYEMWPTPNTNISYMTWYVDELGPLVNNSDELPVPISEDVVLSKARSYAYEWAEARKDVMAARGSGANYMLLKKSAEDDFYNRLKTLRIIDKDTVDATLARITSINSTGYGLLPFFNAQTMRAGMGWPQI